MSKKQQATRDQGPDRVARALRSLTEQELQFFPKTDSMLDQPEESWIKFGDERAQSDRAGHVSRRSDADSAHSGVL